MARGEYPLEVRAQVIADLALGLSIYAIAKARGMSTSTVSAWRDQALADGSLPTVIERMAESRSPVPLQELSELIGEVRRRLSPLPTGSS